MHTKDVRADQDNWTDNCADKKKLILDNRINPKEKFDSERADRKTKYSVVN